jgi:hypothetical protein
MIKKTLLCVAVSVLAAPAAFADSHGASSYGVDLSAAADISSAYLLRGESAEDVSVTGELRADHKSGLYAIGSVVSSGDVYQQNYKVGAEGIIGQYEVDLGYKGYTYKDGVSNEEEVSLDITRGMLALNVVNTMDKEEDDLYIAGSVNMDKITATVGAQSEKYKKYSHVQFDYAATENLTLTASKAFSEDGIDESLKLVVGYSIPLM